ncbi:hypothetical protein [Streptomyces sp. NPDC101776]|uniref:hypothetical protein n=1 Tax=Streptomyces sp. NPDC101776 TaxID=3366146 RepID=UPI003826FE0D
MPEITTEQTTTHTLTLTDAELTQWREAARCALDLGGDNDEHTATWRTISRLGLPPTRSTPSSSARGADWTAGYAAAQADRTGNVAGLAAEHTPTRAADGA